MQTQGVGIDDFQNVVNVRILIAIVVVVFEVVNASLGRAPVNVQVQHFFQWKSGEVDIRIDEQIAASLHAGFAVMNVLVVLHRVRPAEVVVPCMGADVAEDCSAMTLAGFGGSPDVVDEFMIVECEIAWHVAMPFR